MKNTLFLFSCGIFATSSLFAGEMGPAHTEALSTYISVTGGYYESQYQANYTPSLAGITLIRESFNNSYNNGFGQIAIGTGASIGSFHFDHQVITSVLGNRLSLNATNNSTYTFKQQVDFGYDVMPKFNLKKMPRLDLYGILGAHYGLFSYKNTAPSTLIDTYNVSRNQIGFNLGVGLSYAINNTLAVGAKYQHLQYGSTDVYGANAVGTGNEIQTISPSFNLFGIELRFFIG